MKKRGQLTILVVVGVLILVGVIIYVVVKNRDGVYVLASDVVPLYENFRNLRISGQTVNKSDSFTTLKTIRELVGGNIDRVIPGHDPDVFTKFREVAPGVVQINPQ